MSSDDVERAEAFISKFGPETYFLFKAGQISESVAALKLIALVEAGVLSLREVGEKLAESIETQLTFIEERGENYPGMLDTLAKEMVELAQ